MDDLQIDLLIELQQYRMQGKYRKLMQLADSHIKNSKVTKITQYAIRIEKAIIYSSLGLYTKSLSEIKEILPELEKLNVPKILARAYTILGTTSSDIGHNNDAITYMEKALELTEKCENDNALFSLLSNFSVLYRKQKKYDKSLEYLEKVKALCGNNEFMLMSYFSNIAILYTLQDKMETAAYNFEKAIAFAEKNNVKARIPFLLVNYANTFTANPQKGIEVCKKAIALAEDHDQQTVIVSAYKNLSELYNMANDYKNAYLYHIKFHDLDKKIHNTQVEESYQLIQHQIELEQHKKKIEIARIKNEELTNMNKKLEELLHIKNRLFSIIGHDLRGSVSAIVSSFDLLRATPDLPCVKVQEYYDKIQHSIFNIQSFLNDLLIWGQTINGDLQISSETLNIEMICKKVIELHHYQMNLKNINVKTEIDENISCIADNFMLQTILRNLLSNAIKFSHPNNDIIIGAKIKKKMCRIYVEDFGIGIPDKIKEKLFNVDFKFSRNGTNNEKGNGFGLLLCAEFASKMNGKLFVESNQNEGSKFIVLIPCK